MGKRKLNSVICLSVILSFPFLFSQKSENANALQECAFCDSKVLDAQKFYEDSLVIALYTHKPIFPGHCLIIPKRHVRCFEDLTDAEATQITQVIKKVHQAVQSTFHTSSYLLLQKNGPEVGQTVPHVHFHYIPRKTGENSILKFILKMYFVNMRGPMKWHEMQESVINLRNSMDTL